MQLSNQSQLEVLHNLNGHPVLTWKNWRISWQHWIASQDGAEYAHHQAEVTVDASVLRREVV